MSHRWLAASVVVLLPTALASAQPVQSPPIPITRNAPDSLDQPTQYAPASPPALARPASGRGAARAERQLRPQSALSSRVCPFRGAGRVPAAWPLVGQPDAGVRLAAIEARARRGSAERANARRRFDSGADLAAGGGAADTFQGGFGLNFGTWFDHQNTRGIDSSLFMLSGGDTTFAGVVPGMLVVFPGGTDQSGPRSSCFQMARRSSASFPSPFRPGSSPPM